MSAGGSDHAPVAGLVRLLADAFPNPQGAATFLPLRQNITILREVAARLRSAGGGFPVPQFLEPLTFPLRVPAELGTVEFTRRLCLEVGARALLDAGTMVVAARNGRETIDSWLNEFDPATVGVLRIGAVLQRNGCWIRDREGEIDRDCWDVLEAAAAHLKPDIVLLEPPASVDEESGIDALMLRTDEALARRPLVSVQATPRVDAARPTDGASLYVLDDEGVFFMAERHELSLFNTTATLLWCLLEEPRDVHDVVDVYATSFGVPSKDATRLVADALHDWFGRGYISAPGALSGTPVPFSRALAYLVLHAPHRDRFRADPMGLAKDLGLEQEADMLSFAGLDPSALDVLAAECAQESASVDRTVKLSSTDTGRAALQREHRETYRLFGTNFAVRTVDEGLARRIAMAWPQLRHPVEAIDVDVTLRCDGRDQWTIVEDGRISATRLDRRAVVPAVKELMRRLGAERFPSVLNVHAAAVSFGHGAVMLPAAAGSGKTTLTAALVHAGATYFTDEIAPLMAPSFQLAAVPLSLTVKSGSVEPLRSRYADLDSLETYVREDRIEVRYLPPPTSSVAKEQQLERVRWIVFPKYVAGSDTRLSAIGRPSALRRMLDESYLDRSQLTSSVVEGLVQWLRQTECFELSSGSLDEAVALLRGLATDRHGS